MVRAAIAAAPIRSVVLCQGVHQQGRACLLPVHMQTQHSA